MAYLITKTDGTTLVSVADSTADTTTDLTLIGKNYFSFVPCRDADTEPFKKLVLDFKSFPWLTRCRQGHPYEHLENRKPIDIWNAIVDFVITKDFWLGIRFTEPPLFNLVPLI